MGWETHNRRQYYYRSRRVAGRVKKVYCGTADVGRIAAEQDARRCAERRSRQVAWLAECARLTQVRLLSDRLTQICAILTEAVLLARGFHRPNRQPWRRSHAAWRQVRQAI